MPQSFPWVASVPTGSNGQNMTGYPTPVTANARYGAGTANSSVITLSDNTTVVDISVVGGGGVAFKWIASTDTTASCVAVGSNANFDLSIPPNNQRRFIVPIENMGVGSASVVGLNVKYGLYKRLAYVGAAAPASSVLIAEF